MEITFAMKETVYNKYSIKIPDEMKNATDKEIQDYINEHMEDIGYEKELDTIEGEPDYEYYFEKN